MYCLKIFYSAEEAAEKLSLASTKLKADDIHRLAERGILPVCFRYRGPIGVFDQPVKISEPPHIDMVRNFFAIAKKKVHFPGGYLRSSSGAQLGVIFENTQLIEKQIKTTFFKADVLVVGPITVAQTGIGFEGIDQDFTSEVLWLTSDKGQKLRSKKVAIKDWLFHIDDLELLTTKSMCSAPYVKNNEPLDLVGCNKDEQSECISLSLSQPDVPVVQKPWLIRNPSDPAPVQSWYTPARYFARHFVKEDLTLRNKRPLLAKKVSKMLTDSGVKKRGGKLPLDPNTVLKAFSNINFE